MELSSGNVLPLWLPTTHIRLNWEVFGLEQAVGAIKNAVQHRGGVIQRMTAIRRGELYALEKQYIYDQGQIDTRRNGVGKKMVAETFIEVDRICAELSSKGYSDIESKSDNFGCVIRNQLVGIFLEWRERYSNSVQGSGFRLQEFNAPIALRSERRIYFSDPTKLSEKVYIPHLSRAREYGWTIGSTPAIFFTAASLAEQCVIEFLDLAERADRGKVVFPD